VSLPGKYPTVLPTRPVLLALSFDQQQQIVLYQVCRSDVSLLGKYPMNAYNIF
jgi:hypothetical protein